MIRWHHLTAPLAWSAYIAYPSSGWGWMNGLPVGPVEACALALVWWLWAASRQLQGERVMIVLLLAKLALAGVLVDRGFIARYHANDSWAPPVERSAEFHARDFTRRDEHLAFGTPGSPDLPLHFFNDLRFNYFLPDDPPRDQLPYSIEWRGYLVQDAASSIDGLYIDAGEGIAADTAIAGERVTGQAVALAPGLHELVIRVRAPQGASRRIEAGVIVDGRREPFDARRIIARPVGHTRLALDNGLRWLTRALDLGLAAWLLFIAGTRARDAWRGAGFGRLLWLAAIAEALFRARGYAGTVVVLSGGDDWLVYESFSRAIALGDWVGAGQSGPFYFQPFYPYFLALTHLVFGDGFFGLVLVQRLLLAAAATAVTVTTVALFGRRAGLIALVAGGAVLYTTLGPWTDMPLSEMLFIPLVTGWIAVLVRLSRMEASAAGAAAAGVIGGVATLTRSTLLIAWPPILLLWGISLRQHRRRLVAISAVVMLAVISLATVRNWVVSGQFVLIASSFGVNLQIGNPPARPLNPTPASRADAYDGLGLHDPVRGVIEFAVQQPAEFAGGLYRKALYTVGFFRRSGLPGGENMRTSWLYVGMWVLALTAVVRMASRTSGAVDGARWLPLAAALGHFAMMVAVFPFGYGDRIILPIYPLLIPYAAAAIDEAAGLFQGVARTAPRAADQVRVLSAPARGRLATLPAAIARNRRLWIYIAYVLAVFHWLSWRPANTRELDLGSALLLPAGALAVSRFAARGSGGRGSTTRVAALGTACALAGLLLLVLSDVGGVPLARAPGALAEMFGPLGALCCVGLGVRAGFAWPGRWLSKVLVGGSVLVALVALAQAAPGIAARAIVMIVVGALLGAVEAAAAATPRASASAPSR